MLITAALIGLGAYILFHDLPRIAQDKAIEYSWVPHIIVFAGLFIMHGGSAEGTVVAGIATVVFRWLMHRLAYKRHAEADALANPVQHNANQPHVPKWAQDMADEPDTNEFIQYVILLPIVIAIIALALATS